MFKGDKKVILPSGNYPCSGWLLWEVCSLNTSLKILWLLTTNAHYYAKLSGFIFVLHLDAKNEVSKYEMSFEVMVMSIIKVIDFLYDKLNEDHKFMEQVWVSLINKLYWVCNWLMSFKNIHKAVAPRVMEFYFDLIISFNSDCFMWDLF